MALQARWPAKRVTVTFCCIYIFCFDTLGVEKLIDHLVKQNVPIAVATGNSEYEFSLKLKGHFEFLKKFQHKVRYFGHTLNLC